TSYSAHAFKGLARRQETTSQKPDSSRRQTSQSRQLGVEVLERKAGKRPNAVICLS
ncbi:unnamed protein product, partial [Ixodes persulcatus]